METTRVDRVKWEWPATKKPVPAEELHFEESLALFTVALAKEGAAELLRNLASARRDRAIAIANELLEDRTRVQARMVRVFGPRPDGDARLRKLWDESSRALKDAIHRRLPPYQRSMFADHRPRTVEDASPLLGLVAERLIREATR